MIFDEVALGGRIAYLRTDDGSIQLHPGDTGTTPEVEAGASLEVNAIDIYLEVDSAIDLFVRQPDALISFELQKEMFPDLFLDPHSHRIHQVAGAEDFGRSYESDMHIMEIDGVSTLVSRGNQPDCSWLSARYPLPAEAHIVAIAWALAPSRGAPPEALTYEVAFTYWSAGISGSVRLPLTNGPHSLTDARHVWLPNSTVVSGYQMAFGAAIDFDLPVMERHGYVGAQSTGTPLLQGIFLAERLEPLYALHSVHELICVSTSYQLLEPAPPLRRIIARVHLPAVINERESLALHLHSDRVKTCEARVDGRLRRRPVEPRPLGT